MNYNVLKQISKDSEVDLLVFDNKNINKAPRTYVAEICDELIVMNEDSLPGRLQHLFGYLIPMTKWLSKSYIRNVETLRRITENGSYDCVFIDGLSIDYYVNKDLHKNMIISLHDSLAMLYSSFAENSDSIIMRIRYNISARALFFLESIVLKRYRQCLFVSLQDVIYLGSRNNVRHCRVIRNGVNPEFVDFPGVNILDTTLVFTGVLNYKPNVDAVLEFVKRVFPLIVERHPSVIFYVVGRDPVNELKELESKNIVVTGYVENIAAHINRTTVYVSPLKTGAGLKNKILEAMALRTPIVATSISVYGIDVDDGEHLLVRDEAKSFASAVCDLLENEELRNKLVNNAYAMIRTHYTWEEIGRIYKDIVRDY